MLWNQLCVGEGTNIECWLDKYNTFVVGRIISRSSLSSQWLIKLLLLFLSCKNIGAVCIHIEEQVN